MGRLQNNPSIGWVHPKSTHECRLTWGNNNATIVVTKHNWKLWVVTIYTCSL
jgi:hypothetical protein